MPSRWGEKRWSTLWLRAHVPSVFSHGGSYLDLLLNGKELL